MPEPHLPWLPLGEINRAHREAFHAALDRVLDSGRLLLGQELSGFEAAFAHVCGAAHFLGTASGLDALAIAFLALELPEGREVLVPANSFVASALGISRAGLVPVPVDIDPATGNIDPQEIPRKSTPRTRAVLAVHLHGIPAPMDRICQIAESAGLAVVEDAAQAHGAALHGRPCGSFGAAAAFSFYPGKNLGALSDAGGIACRDAGLAGRIALWRNYGSREKYRHELPGWNSRLSDLDAAFLHAKLASLAQENRRRREIAARLRELLIGTSVRLPEVPEGAEPSWHLFPVLSPRRDALRSHLAESGIETLIHYPVPIHRQDCYPGLHRLSLPASEAWCSQTLSLPVHPLLTDAQVERIATAVARFPGT